MGGQDIDNLLIKFIVDKFNENRDEEAKLDLSDNPKALAKCRKLARSVKELFASNVSEVDLTIDSLHDGDDLSDEEIKREEFDEICATLFSDALKPIEDALLEAGLNKADIDEVVLVGGSTRNLKIKEILSDFFDGKPLNKSANPDLVVA